MKYKIIKITNAALIFAVFCLSVCAAVFAQTPPTQTEQLYVISSKAGGVNEIEGDVKVKRADSQVPQVLAKGNSLRDKDRIVTEANGKAEILLNPGSYLRVGENTEIELTSTALDSLKIQLVQGSAIVEANTIGGEKGARVSIITPQTTVLLEKSGLYRINATGATTEIYVWEGLASVGSQKIKAGRRMVIGAGALGAAIARFERANLDALDRWSATRADELAKLNDRLERTALQNALASNYWDNNSYFSGGYWVFDRRTRTWCYVPYYGGRENCCRAYGQNHNTAIAGKPKNHNNTITGKPKENDNAVADKPKDNANVVAGKKKDADISVVYTPRKSDESALDVIYRRSSRDSSGFSSVSSDNNYDYSSSPSSKSDSSSSKNNDSPPRSDPPPAPSKKDEPALLPPSKKDN